MSEENQTNEENQAVEPQWVAELKKWGIDVATFREQWEQTGDDAKVQFQDALANAKAEYESEKSEFDAKMGEVREDVKEFFQQMNTAWDEMVANIQQQLNPQAEENDSADKE